MSSGSSKDGGSGLAILNKAANGLIRNFTTPLWHGFETKIPLNGCRILRATFSELTESNLPPIELVIAAMWLDLWTIGICGAPQMASGLKQPKFNGLTQEHLPSICKRGPL